MSAETFANNVAGTWAALPTSGGVSAHAGVGSNKALVDRATYMKAIKAAKMQHGGIAQMRGGAMAGMPQMIQKTQQDFAQEIAKATTPTVVPIPMGGGGDGQGTSIGTSATPFPELRSEDDSVMSMEYKYRITMGASV